MKNTLKALCVIIGTIIGAGFASGREIYIFFNCYGKKGLAGIIVSSILTGCIIYQVLHQIKHQTIENYHQYVERIGMKASLKEMANSMMNLFLLISFYIMVAGFSAYFAQQWGLSQIFTGLIMITLCYITFLHSMEGITKVNTILIPILMAMIILLGIKNIDGTTTSVNMLTPKRHWFIASIEYASYNSILLIPILISLKKYSHQHEKSIAIISSIIFFALAFILYKIQQTSIINVKEIQLPLVHIVSQYGKVYQYILRRCYRISNFYLCNISRIQLFTKLHKKQKTIQTISHFHLYDIAYYRQNRFCTISRLFISCFWNTKPSSTLFHF